MYYATQWYNDCISQTNLHSASPALDEGCLNNEPVKKSIAHFLEQMYYTFPVSNIFRTTKPPDPYRELLCLPTTSSWCSYINVENIRLQSSVMHFLKNGLL